MRERKEKSTTFSWKMEICIPITLTSLHSNTSLLHLLVTKMYSSIEVVVCIHVQLVLPTLYNVDFILESDFVAHYSFSVKWYKLNSWPKNQKFPLKLATLILRVSVSLSRASFLLQYSWVLTSIRNTDKSLMMMMKSLIIMHDFICSHWANGGYVSVPVPSVTLPIFPKNSKSTKLAGPLLYACMF